MSWYTSIVERWRTAKRLSEKREQLNELKRKREHAMLLRNYAAAKVDAQIAPIFEGTAPQKHVTSEDLINAQEIGAQLRDGGKIEFTLDYGAGRQRYGSIDPAGVDGSGVIVISEAAGGGVLSLIFDDDPAPRNPAEQVAEYLIAEVDLQLDPKKVQAAIDYCNEPAPRTARENLLLRAWMGVVEWRFFVDRSGLSRVKVIDAHTRQCLMLSGGYADFASAWKAAHKIGFDPAVDTFLKE